MSGSEIYITRLSAWAPGMGSWTLSDPGEWGEWAAGARNISFAGKGPDLAFADSMFRRRLSQISKMTIQVIHDLLPLEEETKIFFLSFRGELSRQYQINKMLIEEKSLSPAAFSLSVFNAPVALASMALGLKGGYTALYPGKNSFIAGIKAAQAALLCGTTEELVFVYADEQIPPEYESFFQNCPFPAAFGLLLSRNPVSQVSRSPIPLSSLKEEGNPLDFFRQILLRGETYVSS
jgi:hypothetical protein